MRPSWSLVVFTVLTQVSVGLHLMRAWFRHAIFECGPPTEVGTIVDPIRPAALVILAIGTAAAMLHLGRVGAARFTLSNLKSSWLSRELALVLLFGAALIVLRQVEGPPPPEIPLPEPPVPEPAWLLRPYSLHCHRWPTW